MHVFVVPKKLTKVHALFQFVSKHITYFVQFVSVGFQQTMGLPSLLSLVMVLCTVVVKHVLAKPFWFGPIKSYFLKNKVI